MLERLQKKTIGVLMGGLSPEREVSLTSGQAVHQALEKKGLTSHLIDVDSNVAAQLQEKRVDLAFIALHGTYGEDGAIQGVLEYLGIPYTGSGVLGSALAYNKVVSKRMFQQAGIPTAPFQVLRRNALDATKRSLPLPVVVKPSDQGSSIGVSIVKEEADWQPALDDAFKISEEVVIEQFIEGKLLAIGMNQSTPLPIVEIKPKSGFYDYEAKYTPGQTEYVCPADISKDDANFCNETAVKVFEVLQGRGFPRVDVILAEDGIPFVLEMNTIPGMTATSLLPMAARQAGMEFDDLVVRILNTAQLDYSAGSY